MQSDPSPFRIPSHARRGWKLFIPKCGTGSSGNYIIGSAGGRAHMVERAPRRYKLQSPEHVRRIEVVLFLEVSIHSRDSVYMDTQTRVGYLGEL